MTSFLFQIPALLISCILFIGMMMMNRLGFYFFKREQKKYPAATNEGLGAIEGSLLGLLALLLSFTFGMSAAKSDTRRQIIVQEANVIGTAILRSDLYPDSNKKQFNTLFKNYVDSRIDYYQAGVNDEKLNKTLQNSNGYATALWKYAAMLSQDKENTFRSQQMIPALNEMMDMLTTRDADRNAHVPESILWMLFLLTLTGSFIMGYGAKGKRFNWIITGGFALVTVMTVYLIMDLDRPRRGIINMDLTHQKIVELRTLLVN